MLDPRRPHHSIQLRSLRLFCEVVRKKNFSAAATEYGLTQGAASQAVQHLEDLVDVQLLDRSTRPFVLTAEGQKFYEGVSEFLRGFDSLLDEVRGKAGDVSGYISIASIYSIGLSYLPSLEEQFRLRFPNATIQNQMAHPDEVYQLVEQGKVDIGFVSYPESSRTIIATPWREEQMILVASPRHRLASVTTVRPKDLSGVGLVAFAQELPIRHAIDRALRALDISTRIVVELDNIDSVKHAAIVNSGIAVLPELTVQQELNAGSLRRLNCPEFKLTRPIGYLQRRDKTLSRVARCLIELLAQSNPLFETDKLSIASNADVKPANKRAGKEKKTTKTPSKVDASSSRKKAALSSQATTSTAGLNDPLSTHASSVVSAK